jgi:hypothetical protein
MKSGRFQKCRTLQTIFAMLAGVGLLMLAAPSGVQADSLATFNFSGTLANPVNGDASVTGQFTLDLTNETITAFDFITPVETISSTGNSPIWTPTLFAVTAISPNAPFVDLIFIPGGGLNPPDAFELLFQTTLAAFDVSSFYTGVVVLSGGPTQSNLSCENGCNGYGSTFVTPTPEPASLVLFCIGLLCLIPFLPYRLSRRHA